MILGFFIPWIAFGAILALHVVLPGRWIDGYVRDDHDRPLRYRLNGLVVLVATVGIAVLLVAVNAVPADELWRHRWAELAGACVFGLLFTGALVLPAPPTGKPLLADLYLGRRENPRWRGGRVDAKMFLYLAGAVLLELNVLSFAAHQDRAIGHLSAAVALSAGLLTYFVVDYLTFEHVHLYTYDLFAERVGFKLGWGCLVFYPYFYCVGLWARADQPDPHAPLWLLVLAGVVFATGWTLARGANMQKFLFKRDPTARAFGLLEPRSVSDGERTLLCGGFWGAARHINYLGEILMATGITLALGTPGDPWPWLYPLYYVGLLVPRQIDDDRRCAAKYGALWDEYRARVRWRIIPGIY
ncbi:ergosterol biosynthesis protein [Frankia sp. AgB1.9]|uniref:ergosterol biosynthesis protein n=1 Tax=unclassified Frankia TaxID=2632575 RepID=UPI0019348302|nr:MULTISPECIES: ergosterol biosynthesis protein [unclassified Frankia]MBL7488879.1 ergosterol biosynthesis protein [Frankia sp. AgW1.1]MBL7547615.1 ergosterol biosynthesis protein [Frankia sp. AgB1.9]MBL7621494.1 ergosterol biosynthesis protein [Frankia sp. AgB1.8]